MDNPIVVEVLRGPRVESFHRGAGAVVDADGRIVLAFGDVERPIYPRSAVKALQALPLIESLTERGILCGDNEPYSGRLANHTVDRHGQDAGRRHVSIEIRQDEIADEAGALRWARLLADVLEGVLTI